MSSLTERIRQRKVIQWGLAYLACGWASLEACDLLAEYFGWPPGLVRGLIILLGGGFAATVTIAWYHGEKGVQRIPPAEVFLLAGIVMVTVGGLSVIRQDVRSAVVVAPSAAGTTLRNPELPSLAVLPIDQYGNEERAERLGEAIHAEVIARLSRLPDLSVTHRTSVMALRGSSLSVRQIADTLRVRYLLESSVTLGVEHIKIIAQLIDARRNALIWSDQREFGNVAPFAAQEEMAHWLSSNVAALLTGGRTPEISFPVADPQAEQDYQNAQYWINSRRQEDLERAIGTLEEIVRHHPGFARAYAAAAVAYGLWGTYGYGGANAGYEAFGRAVHLADRAVALDPSLGEAYAARAFLLTKAFYPADTVTVVLGDALELIPSSAETHIFHALFLAREEQFESSLAAAELAVRLDPLAPGREAGLGWDALAAGLPQVALSAAERANVLEPSLMTPRVIRAYALLLLDRPTECLNLDLGAYDAVRATCLQAVGRTAEAEDLIESVIAHPVRSVPQQHLASYFAWTGDAQRSLEALRQGFTDTPHGLDFRVISSGIFDGVRSDWRFARGLQRLKRDVRERVELARSNARDASLSGIADPVDSH